MERIRSDKKRFTANQLHNLAGVLVARMTLATQLGFQYDGNRDVYKALGYPITLTFPDFLGKYNRHDLAKAIIDRPVKATWQGALELIESERSEDTTFEEEWKKLNRRLGLKSKLSRLDRLTGIGRYGILLLGFNGVSSNAEFEKPVNISGKLKLLYVKPFGENSAQITELEKDPKNERFGQPKIYTIEVSDAETGGNFFVKVHHSRIIHILDDPLESDIYGTPRLEVVYNRLMDLDKLVGGDAEMFWRGARPGYAGNLDKDYTMTKAEEDALMAQIDEYENNFRRILLMSGINMKALDQQIASPKEHFDVIIACISAVTGIPQRVLMGSERGELASTQDSSEWKDYVQARRDDHAEPNIIRPFIDSMIKYGILPKPVTEDYTVKWNDLYSLSEKAKVEVGKSRANALREYTYNPIAQAIISPDAFLEFFLGLTTEQKTLIRKMRDDMISEDELNSKVIDSLEPKPTPSIPAGRPIAARRRRV